MFARLENVNQAPQMLIKRLNHGFHMCLGEEELKPIDLMGLTKGLMSSKREYERYYPEEINIISRRCSSAEGENQEEEEIFSTK